MITPSEARKRSANDMYLQSYLYSFSFSSRSLTLACFLAADGQTSVALCRSRGLDTALSDDAALKGMVPPAMQWLFKSGPLGMALIRSQVRALARKYPRPYDEAELKAALGKIGTGIQASSSGYLVGEHLSYAGALLPVLWKILCARLCTYTLQSAIMTWPVSPNQAQSRAG